MGSGSRYGFMLGATLISSRADGTGSRSIMNFETECQMRNRCYGDLGAKLRKGRKQHVPGQRLVVSGAGLERLIGSISCPPLSPLRRSCNPRQQGSRAGRRIHDPFGWQMIGQRTACQLLAGEGASRVLDAEIM